jgi:hypothetical protein
MQLIAPISAPHVAAGGMSDGHRTPGALARSRASFRK